MKMPPSIVAGDASAAPQPAASPVKSGDKDCPIMSSLTAALSTMDTNKNNNHHHPGNQTTTQNGNNNYFSSSNRIRGEGSSSSSLSSTVGSGTLWGSPPPSFSSVSTTTFGNYLPVGAGGTGSNINDTSNQVRRDSGNHQEMSSRLHDNLYPTSSSSSTSHIHGGSSSNPNHNHMLRYGYQPPTQQQQQQQPTHMDRKKGMGTAISAPSHSLFHNPEHNNSSNNLENHHPLQNTAHNNNNGMSVLDGTELNQDADYLVGLSNESGFQSRRVNVNPIGSIGSSSTTTDTHSNVNKYTARKSSSSSSPTQPSSTYHQQDRTTSQQLFHLTGNMNAVMPPDNNNNNHHHPNHHPLSAHPQQQQQQQQQHTHNRRKPPSNHLHWNNNPHSLHGGSTDPMHHTTSTMMVSHDHQEPRGGGGMSNVNNAMNNRLHYGNPTTFYQPEEQQQHYPGNFVPNTQPHHHHNHHHRSMPSNNVQYDPNGTEGLGMGMMEQPKQIHVAPTDINNNNNPYKTSTIGHTYSDQPQVVSMENGNFPMIHNANPQQQIFYMAVPMQNGTGQMLQPVQMVQLGNGQSTFVVAPAQQQQQQQQQQQPSFMRKDKHMMSSSNQPPHHHPRFDGMKSSPHVMNNNSGTVNPIVYNNNTPAQNSSSSNSNSNNMNKRKEKRNKGKNNNVSKQQENAFSNNNGGSLNPQHHPRDLTPDYSLQKQPYEDRQLTNNNNNSNSNSHPQQQQQPSNNNNNNNNNMSLPLPNVPAAASSDAITALYHSTQRPPLSSLLGHVRRLSRDQVGCRLLQQSLDEDGPHAATAILTEGLPFLTEAMTDPFGNYLFQKILEKVTWQERLLLITTVGPRLVNAALNLHGTRSVQKVVEMSVGDAKAAEIVTQSLAPAAARLCIDSHGNHVIQRILQKLPHEHSKFVFDAVANSVGDVARHRHGCCVIQRCLDSPSSPARSNLVKRIVEKSLDLMQDAYGNYVVQYVLDVCGDDEAAAVCESVVGKIGLLAIQKFSSNVMEKCLERSSDRVQELHLLELSAPDKIRELMADPFGNYVVQKALSVATHAQAVRLVEAMRPHLPGMRNTAGGRRIVAKIVRRFPRFTTNLGMEESGIINNNNNTLPMDPQPLSLHQHHVNYSQHPMGYNNNNNNNNNMNGHADPPALGMPTSKRSSPLLGAHNHHNNDHHHHHHHHHRNGATMADGSGEIHNVDTLRMHANMGRS